MYLLTCIISEDRERYSLVLNQSVLPPHRHHQRHRRRCPCSSRFPSELNVGHISADTLWKLLSTDLKDHLEGKLRSREMNGRELVLEHGRLPSERREIKSAAYMNLQFMVKSFYDTSVKVLPEAKNSVAEYPK